MVAVRIPGCVRCTTAPDGLHRIQVHDDAASAEISLCGGQLLDCRHPGDTSEYRRFVCIETANAGDELIAIKPDRRSTLRAG